MRTQPSHLLLVGVGLAGLVMLAVLGLSVWSFLPFLAVLALCPLMMFLMIRWMSNGSTSQGDGVEQKQAHSR